MSKKRLAALLLGVQALLVVFFFQNCGDGFKGPSDQQILSSLADPSVKFLSAVPLVTNQTSVTIEFSTEVDPSISVKNILCQVDDNAPVDCASGVYTLEGLQDGDHVFRVLVEDIAGQKTQSAGLVFNVDATVPVLTVNESPASISGSTSASIAFSGSDSGSGLQNFECSLDGAAYAPCASPLQLADLASGNHGLKIRALDRAGNYSPESSVSWKVDKEAPIITILKKPEAAVKSRLAEVVFEAVDEGQQISDFECSFDDSNFLACTSPQAFSELKEGPHKLAIRAKDAFANLSMPTNVQWTVDTLPPSRPIIKSDASSRYPVEDSWTVSFSSADSGSGVARYECSRNTFSGPWEPCTSPVTIKSTDTGSSSISSRVWFQVRAVDAAGNISDFAYSYWYPR